MRYLSIIIMAASLALAACGKHSSSVATAPATTNTTTTTTTTTTGTVSYIPGLPAPINGQYYVGSVSNINSAVYQKFLKAGLGVYMDNGQFGDGTSYSWNYTCDFNIFSFFINGQGLSCQSEQDQINQYVAQQASYPAAVTMTIYPNGEVDGYWYTNATTHYGTVYGYQYPYTLEIPFSGTIQLINGQYVVEAGPLSFVTTAAAPANFGVFFFDGNTDAQFGILTLQ